VDGGFVRPEIVHGPAPPEAVHERGSHACRASVDPEGADRLALPANGPGSVVGVVVPVPEPEGTLEVVEDGPGPVFDEGAPAGAFTAKLEPVTTTTSAPSERDSVEPTSMVLVVVDPVDPPLPVDAPPPAPPVAVLTSPGS